MIMTQKPLAFIGSLLIASALASAAGPATQIAPLGIGFEEWPYPHEVRFLPLTIQGRDVRMAYMDVKPAGESNGRTVVLLHGKNFYGAYFEAVIARLSQDGFRVVVPDQIGWGKSSKPTDVHYSFDLLAANTAKLLDELKVEKAAVLGHSMGGMLAAHFAYLYPDRTEKLVLENPIGLEDYRLKGVPPRSLEEAYAGELKKTPESVLKYYKAYFVKWDDAYARWSEPLMRVTASGEYPRFALNAAITYQMIYQQPVRHEFSQITVPTLLIIGQGDRTAIGKDMARKEQQANLGQYPQLGKEAARDIPGAKLAEIPNVGHIPHIESPEAFFDVLLPFLK
jgi:pimeloyl-ACP methyl ester carboxylesterase